MHFLSATLMSFIATFIEYAWIKDTLGQLYFVPCRELNIIMGKQTFWYWEIFFLKGGSTVLCIPWLLNIISYGTCLFLRQEYGTQRPPLVQYNWSRPLQRNLRLPLLRTWDYYYDVAREQQLEDRLRLLPAKHYSIAYSWVSGGFKRMYF